MYVLKIILFTLQDKIGFNHRVITLVGAYIARKMAVMRSSFLLLETNWIKQPESQLPSSSYSHNTPTILRTSVRELLGCMGVSYCNFEVHL